VLAGTAIGFVAWTLNASVWWWLAVPVGLTVAIDELRLPILWLRQK
jgi:hypothetical protein